MSLPLPAPSFDVERIRRSAMDTQAIRLVSWGWDIGEISRVSKEPAAKVEARLARLRRAFAARTDAELVARALRARIIT